MATCKKYNLKGEETGEVKIDDALALAEANGQSVKDYIVAIRENARQWSANTRTRAEVSHTTKKPHRQKGTGKARQGSRVTPQYRGGGIVFGPKPKFDQHVRINRKERRAAIRFILAEKIRAGGLKVIETLQLDAPKTKTVANFLVNIEAKGRTLFLTEGAWQEVEVEGKKTRVSVTKNDHQAFLKSTGNIQKVEFNFASNVSGYDVMLANNIVVTEAALKELTEWLV